MTIRTDLHRLGRDPHFRAAHLAALLVWSVGYFWLDPRVDPAWPIVQFQTLVILGIGYPVVEEWVFRGMLQGYLRGYSRLRAAWLGITPANLLVSLVFTALHFIYHPPLAAALVLVPSLVFGYFRDRHGNLIGPVWLHMFYNIGYFWLFTSGA